MADERYKKLLDIEPAGEFPTHYELLRIDRDESDKDVLEAKYKEQMRKVQSVRSSKDKGFIEFLKDELRKARLTLTNPKRREAYDESLLEDAIEDFKTWVEPMMAMGTVTRGLYDAFVANGVSMGLGEAQAGELIQEVAAAHNATLQLDDAPTTGSGAGAVDAGVAADPGQVDEPIFSDEATGAPRGVPPRVGRGETVLPGAAQTARPPRPQPRSPAHSAPPQGIGFWDEAGGGAAATAPAPAPERTRPPPRKKKKAWARGGRSTGSAWRKRGADGRAPSSGGGVVEDTHSQRARWRNQNDQTRAGEACRRFNDGAKLAGVANRVHEELRLFFPPANGRTSVTYQRNGVTYEKVFDTEHKTYRDALKRFQAALEKVDSLGDPASNEVRQRANQNIGLVKGYLEEIRQHKLRQLSGLSKAQEMRMWQTFVENKRSARLGETIDT